MKLLIVTQTVDEKDPVLGFFVRWIEEFAQRVESIEVVCLYRGVYHLPANVKVHSLGKEQRITSRATYTLRFLLLSWRLRREYDAVFVHMNQEYLLIAGWLWKLFNKRMYLWRNHYAGSWLTGVAVLFCQKVFCTSRHSYTARYVKSVLMPVGVDTERFMPDGQIARAPHSILWLARIAPSKRLEMFSEALEALVAHGVAFSATIVGSPLPEHQSYYDELRANVRARGLNERVVFRPGVPNAETADLYHAHQIFVNTSPSGMLDKTIFEAAACGCVVMASSQDLEPVPGAVYVFDSAQALAARLTEVLVGSSGSAQGLVRFVGPHTLSALTDALSRELEWKT